MMFATDNSLQVTLMMTLSFISWSMIKTTFKDSNLFLPGTSPLVEKLNKSVETPEDEAIEKHVTQKI